MHPGAHFMVHRVAAQRANTDNEKENTRHMVITLRLLVLMRTPPHLYVVCVCDAGVLMGLLS